MLKRLNIFCLLTIAIFAAYSQAELPYSSGTYDFLKLFGEIDTIHTIRPAPASTAINGKTVALRPLLAYNTRLEAGSKPEYSLLAGALYQRVAGKFFIEAIPYIYGGIINGQTYIPGFPTKFYEKTDENFSLYDIRWKLAYQPAKYIGFSVGKGKLFLGDGYRSLLLSDQGGPYYYFRGRVDVWHIKYVWQVAGGHDRDSIYFGIEDRNMKYFAMHYLEWQARKWLSIQLFETVIWPDKTEYGKRGLELDYLNPIIFYRPLEFDLGSGDNVIMGGALRINISKFILYSQFLLDEFRVKEFLAGNGWWGNKFSIQGGIKHYGKKYFVLSEANFVRPFTYSHRLPLSNYGMENQPLAHPLGAGFAEFLIRAGYKLSYNKALAFYFDAYKQMLNTESRNYGSDIYIPYDYMREEYGNYMFAGNDLTVIDANVNFMILADDELMEYIYVKTGMRLYRTDNSPQFTTCPYVEIGLKCGIF